MKRIIFILVLFFFGSNICAKEYFVHSPNKRIEVRVNVSNGVRYNVFLIMILFLKTVQCR